MLLIKVFQPLPIRYQHFHIDKLPTEEPNVSYSIFVVDVKSRLKAVKSNKAPGPDALPNWILDSFSIELSEPVTIILMPPLSRHKPQNSGRKQMRYSYPRDITSHRYIFEAATQCISLNATLSKILESFPFQWIMDALSILNWTQCNLDLKNAVP